MLLSEEQIECIGKGSKPIHQRAVNMYCDSQSYVERNQLHCNVFSYHTQFSHGKLWLLSHDPIHAKNARAHIHRLRKRTYEHAHTGERNANLFEYKKKKRSTNENVTTDSFTFTLNICIFITTKEKCIVCEVWAHSIQWPRRNIETMRISKRLRSFRRNVSIWLVFVLSTSQARDKGTKLIFSFSVLAADIGHATIYYRSVSNTKRTSWRRTYDFPSKN